MITIAAFSLLVGCAKTPTYDDLRTTCGFSPEESTPEPFLDGRIISADCATALGEATGVNWDMFGGGPHELDGPDDDVGDLVIVGLYTYLFSDLGTYHDIKVETYDNEAIWLAFQDSDHYGDLVDTDPAGKFWLRWLTTNITDGIMPDDSGRASDMMYASYGMGRMWVNRDDVDAGTDDVFMGEALAHEAAHALVRPHLRSESGIVYDETSGGAFGAGAHWAWDWWKRNAAADPERCAPAYQEILFECVRIGEWGGFAPCATEQTGMPDGVCPPS